MVTNDETARGRARVVSLWATPLIACVSAGLFLVGGLLLGAAAPSGALLPILGSLGAMLAGVASLAVHILAVDARQEPPAPEPQEAAPADWWPDFERAFWDHVAVQDEESAEA